MEEAHWWFLGRRSIMGELVRRALPRAGPGTVVDFGCGTGANIASLASEYPCVGIDPSEEAIRSAQARFPGVRFVCLPGMEGADGILAQARLVLLMDVLEHTADDFDFFSRLLAPVPPGAHLLITVPAKEALWSEHDVSFGHYRRYEMDRLVRVWSGLPVEACLVSYYIARLYPAILVIRAFNRLAGRTSGVEGTDFRIPARPLNRVLERVVAGEARRLIEVLDGRRLVGYSRGASLVALLRRREGPVTPRSRPEGLTR